MYIFSSDHQRGSALIYIMIAIVLFAALSYAISASMQGGGNNNLSKERAGVVASEIMDFATATTETVSKLRINGCPMSQISFDNNIITPDYDNGTAPADGTCNVFAPAGGGMNWPKFPNDAFDNVWSAEPDFQYPIFTIKNQVPEMGSSGAMADNYDLLMIVEGLKKNVCEVINKRLFNNVTIPVASDDVETKYNGVINTAGVFTFPAAFNGRRQSCYQDGAGSDKDNYSYYFIISVR